MSILYAKKILITFPLIMNILRAYREDKVKIKREAGLEDMTD